MERRAIAIQGVVQGVGFRPFVYEIAHRLGLSGFVRNETGNVLVEVEGETSSVEQFLIELTMRPPPLARIERVDWSTQRPRGDDHFEISPSDPGNSRDVSICSDIATCDDCIRELFDPGNRRYRYPFINCTNCGPRLTIVKGAPYDRHRTTMGGFEMCDACRAEYENPLDRRFHAQPTACGKCGPRLSLLDCEGHAIASEPLRAVVAALKAGKIVAIKGLGGYHLACDARSHDAVAELRRRKHRDEKPFAVMVADVAAAKRLCHINFAEIQLLTSPPRPIVLLKKRDDAQLCDGIAPRNPSLGLMLPYTPLHHLLLHDLGNIPLVMTSGNRSDEPIAYEDANAVLRLTGIADLFLAHDRPIHVRCDDSVTRIVAGEESPLRRSRGYAPLPVSLPMECPEPILAVGGQLKNTFALGRRRQAILSQHLGDLDHLHAFSAFQRDIRLFEKLFAIEPRCLVHDLHPDYASTRYARERHEQTGIPCLAVQHHHAHMASCMAEHGLVEPVIGVSFDGTGYGTDGAIWGGEVLVGDYLQFHRAAHLRYVAMPGGEKAIHEPWRMAWAHLRDAGVSLGAFEDRIPRSSLRAADQMLDRKFNSPITSSAGRLFDAIASLINLCDIAKFEGQAAMKLEWLATRAWADGVYPFGFESDDIIDTRPLIRAVVEDMNDSTDPATIARRFHSTLVHLIRSACNRIRHQTEINTVALSGGVFMNVLLTTELSDRLRDDDFQVFRHRQVPTNDGGISLGQIAIAAAQMNAATKESSCA